MKQKDLARTDTHVDVVAVCPQCGELHQASPDRSERHLVNLVVDTTKIYVCDTCGIKMDTAILKTVVTQTYELHSIKEK